MFVLGLTGSIGMGKSETAKMFRRLGVPVYDADAAVHALQAPGGAALPSIEAAFPGVVHDGVLDRAALRSRVVGDAAALRRLEGIIHPMVGRRQRAFLAGAVRRREPLVVIDVPLLFETNGEARCDATAVVSAPFAIQKARVLARPNMDADTFAKILRQQVPDVVKRQRADFIIPSSLGRRHALSCVRHIVKLCRQRIGHAWPPRGLPRRRPPRHPSRRSIHARSRSGH